MQIITSNITDNYFGLLRNLSIRAKLELISKLTNSLLEPNNQKKEQLLNCFGSFVSDNSAEEIIYDIRNFRNFRKKDIYL